MSIIVANTKFGAVRGIGLTGKYEGITTFRSVPYAAPPIGDLRFRPPVDPAPWKGELDATMTASKPMQPTSSGLSMEPWASDFYYLGNPPMSEDCLYLHITTGAADPSERRPVFMWFHGGGLATGYYTEIEFDPSELARKGIVVVSVGQRLNVFGYLCLKQLSEEQGGISGNYGLMDEIKALDWVRENIANFGGDPDNITVGGQSGGTAKSTSLATSPKSVGKVKRCINQSNLAWMRNYLTMDEAQDANKKYLENLGLDPDITPEELRKLPAFKFYDFVNEPGFGAPGGLPGMMVADGVNIVYPEAEKNMAEFGCGVDYLSGGNVGEGSVRGRGLGPSQKFESAAEFYGYMREKLGDELFDKYDFEQLWPVNDENADYLSRVLASRAFGGGLGIMGGVITNRYFGAYRAKTAPGVRNWSYAFGRYLPCRPEEKGTFRDTENLLAWHSGELWYTFGALRDGMPASRPWEPIDFELAEQLSSYWANFIATGDPNGTDSYGHPLPVWPESRENFGWMEITNEGPVGHEGITDLDKLTLEYIEKNLDYPAL